MNTRQLIKTLGREGALLLAGMVLFAGGAYAQKITVKSAGRPASEVFADIMRQSGKNFIYTSDVLKGVKLKVNVKNESLEKTLSKMFSGTNIEYKVRGNNILLVRKPKKVSQVKRTPNDPLQTEPDSIKVGILRDLVVEGSKNQTIKMNSASIGALNLSRSVIAHTPTILGESDVVKTLQFEPGVSPGVEGMAGMYVHGGGVDENLYMLDNIPLYQVNHAFGLFSAFNTEAIQNVDFYKSTYPAKFDGRLSSFLDVYTREGAKKGYHGSVRLGLTSGVFNIEGPIWKDRTTFSFAIRRSWYDILSIPACAIYNAVNKKGNDDFSIGYAFTDVNAKITHRFNDRSRIYGMFYYGEDYIHYKTWNDGRQSNSTFYYKNTDKLRWGNILGSAGWIYDFTPRLWGRINGAYTHYRSKLRNTRIDREYEDFDSDEVVYNTEYTSETYNIISDWILRADFEWRSSDINRLNFGAGFTWHTYQPDRNYRTLIDKDMVKETNALSPTYRAGEWNFYAEDDLTLFDRLHINGGLHYSIFNISGKSHDVLSPRLALSWSNGDVAVKGGYSRTVQYVHQLQQSSISLPTDQWVPIVGEQRPQTADKIAAGVYWKPRNLLTVSVEAYWKWMHNLLDYREDYYLLPPEMQWDAKLCEGRGTAKGIDFKIAKEYGKVNGHIAYSLLWADRQFADRNGGRRYPARNDNRHKINVLVNWKINDKWEIAAAWTGMSGNRITLPVQYWRDPMIGPWHYDVAYQSDVNNYRLPFYHRLDLSFTRHTKHGYWNFSLYNAYCSMNTIGVFADYKDVEKTHVDNYGNITTSYDMVPVFKKIRLIPVIPSVSYTWLF